MEKYLISKKKINPREEIQCFQCKGVIPNGTEYCCVHDDSFLMKNWCLDCGKKQNQKLEKFEEEYQAGRREGTNFLFKLIFSSVAVSIFVLGITDSFIVAFLISFLLLFIYYYIKDYREEPPMMLYTIPIALLVIIGLSVAVFCKIQDSLNFEWLSDKTCSGTIGWPE